MGFIGKLLVVLHGALSLAVLGWATGVFTHHIDWNTPPTETGRGAGLFERQAKQVEEYNLAVDRAHPRWQSNVSQVVVLEGERYPRRAYYATMIRMATTGKIPKNNMPGEDVVPNPVKNLYPLDATTGYLNTQTPTARPAFNVRDAKMGAAAVAALSVEEYQRLSNKLAEDVQASQKLNEAALVERDKLNKEINGVTDPMLIKGLRTQLAEQLQIKDRAETEDRYVIGFVTNNESNFDLVRKRRDALNVRIEELKKAGYPEKRN
jgi:hypothetical protein